MIQSIIEILRKEQKANVRRRFVLRAFCESLMRHHMFRRDCRETEKMRPTLHHHQSAFLLPQSYNLRNPNQQSYRSVLGTIAADH